MDNCVDLALKGMNNLAHLIFDPEPGVYWIVDAGPGFPVGVEKFENEHGKEEKLNTFYVATGLTHAGSNFKTATRSVAVHTASASRRRTRCRRLFQVWTCYKDQWWTIKYKDTVCVESTGEVQGTEACHTESRSRSGSVIRAVPDLDPVRQGCQD
jgi:hypothetical protein